MFKKRFLSAFMFLPNFASAVTIGVVDSGLDATHPMLENHIWINSAETPDNKKDDEGNGYVDDLMGWNFVSQNGTLIDPDYGIYYSPEVVRFFELQQKGILGELTVEDRIWVEACLRDNRFMKRVATYANYAHGTHVAYLTAARTDGHKVMGLKIIPTENPWMSLVQSVTKAEKEGRDFDWITNQVVKVGLFGLAQTQGTILNDVATFIQKHNVDVINGSFGVGKTQAMMFVKMLLTLAKGGDEPSDDLVRGLSKFFLKQVLLAQQSMVDRAPGTLFVFAAGNDGASNDIFPTAPASIDHPRVISVGAAFEDGSLAPFSNYGEKVHVRAPGVNIKSAVPDGKLLSLSGTSQASPQVARLAGIAWTLNPKLTAEGVKELILGTADEALSNGQRNTLKGMVNEERLRFAAEQTRTVTLKEALQASFQAVPLTAGQSFVPPVHQDSKVLGPLFMPNALGL